MAKNKTKLKKLRKIVRPVAKKTKMPALIKNMKGRSSFIDARQSIVCIKNF